eukprot:TRINITY_DN20026_c0_g1_i1.p1 TRINITY_DN20026_c0_g1~~TRINITY_DN20026_c0_g1_i1.p1  ORF type:complete len:147 (-),score=53.58 TRINITY_DN20026_c0_g1_i1:29-469(-)
MDFPKHTYQINLENITRAFLDPLHDNIVSAALKAPRASSSLSSSTGSNGLLGNESPTLPPITSPAPIGAPRLTPFNLAAGATSSSSSLANAATTVLPPIPTAATSSSSQQQGGDPHNRSVIIAVAAADPQQGGGGAPAPGEAASEN